MKKKRLLTIASSVLLAFVMILGTMPGLNQMAYASDDSWTIADEIEEDILIEPAEEIIIEATDELEESDVLEYELVGSSEDPFYSYTVKSDGTICIDKYLGDEQVVVIPSTIEGAIVTEIGANAFQNCTGITEIGFPEDLTSVGDFAFQSCGGLTALDLPGGVTTIGYYAFSGCTGLTEVTIHDVPGAEETIMGGAFVGCTSLQKVSVPASAKYLNYEAGWHTYRGPFNEDTAISEVTVTGSGEMSGSGNGPWYSAGGDITLTIAEGVTSIRSGAFSGFAYDMDLVLADSVESIGDSAFSNCTGLSMGTVDTVLNSEAVLGSNIFSGCTGLEGALNVPRELPAGAFSGCTGLSSVAMAHEITVIPNNAFQNCRGITEIGFPEDLTTVGEYAFQNCGGLTALDLPGSVTTIGYYAFSGCTGLTEVTIHDVPGAEETIMGGAFVGCTSLQKVSVPASAKYMNYEVGWHTYRGPFNEDTAISEVTVTGSGEMSGSGNGPWYSAGGDITLTIAEGVTSIRSDAFNGFTYDMDLELADSVETIGSNAFKNCTGLSMGTVDTVLNSEAVLGDYIFSGCTGLSGALNVPRELPAGSFQGCTGLSSVAMADEITVIPNNAFQNCTSITEIVFPEDLTTVGEYAFQSCSGLTMLDLPGGVTTIGYYAFQGCTGLTEVTIHDVPDAEETIQGGAFAGCTSLEKVSVPASAKYMNYEVGWHTYRGPFNEDTAISEVTVTGSGEMSGSGNGPWSSAGDDVIVIIEDGVTSIRNDMVNGSSNMIMTVIPNSVKTIGNNAFNNCTSLADVFFVGWKEEWDGITKGSGNSGLDEAEIHTLDDAAKENYIDATCVTDGKYDAVLYYKEQIEIARVTIGIPANGHAFAYTLSDDEMSITAVCSVETCPSGYHENGITIKLNVPENLTWDGNAKNATISGYPNDVPGLADEPEIIYYKSGGEGSTTPSGEPLSAAPSAIGSYVAQITWGEKTASAAFTIIKPTYRIVTPPSASPITYGQTLEDSTLSGGKAEINGSFAWKDKSGAPAVSDSGRTEYAVVFTPDDIEHYDTAECKVTVIVNKAASSVASAPTAKALAWSGQAQKLVDEGIAEFGVMRYSIGQNETTAPRSGWSESVPEASDPNTYYVWYKAAGDENHYDSEAACVTSTITAKQISYIVTFKVVNGAWNDRSTADKTVTLSRYENEDLVLKLSEEDIPAVGNEPAENYMAGSWDVVPDKETAITGNTSYTYTYAGKTYAFSDVQDPKHAYFNAIYWAADAGITKGYPDGTFGINRSCTRGEMMMFLWRYADKPAPKNSSKSPFKDVKTNHAFYKAILWGSQKGITKGYADGTFGIDRNVTCGEAMMFLWRLRGKPAPKAVAKSPFKDVPKNHVFYNAILWGSQNKITTGYTSGVNKGKFMVDDNCTRGQIVTFLYRAK